MKEIKPTPEKVRTKGANDPLYVIFEQHLYNFQDSDLDRKSFIERVVQDYVSYLRKNNITIPKSLEASIIEELSLQIQTMLVKKIYGSPSIQHYQKSLPTEVRRKARVKYSKLAR